MGYQLIDKFGRKHDYLRISLTDKCNLRCLYCMPEKTSFLPGNKLLKSNEIIKLATLFVNQFDIKKIRFTGGEPLMRNDAHYIIEGISKLAVKLSITTNGIFLNNFFDLFEKIELSSVNISFDSLNPDVFYSITKSNRFQLIKENIDEAIRKGFNVKINCVMMRNINDCEILDFVKWTLGTRIHVRFIEFMPFLNNSWDWNKVITYNEIKEKIESIFVLEKLNDGPNSTSKSFRVKNAIGTIAFISTVTEPFCDDCNRLRLSADGKLRNCLFARNEIDLITAFRNGSNIEHLIISNVKLKDYGQVGKFLAQNVPQNYMVTLGG